MPGPYRRPVPFQRHIGILLVVVAWIVIAIATLMPGGADQDTAPASCLACGQDWGADALANVLLFLPLGAGLWLARVRPLRAFVLVACTTLGVESLQLSVVVGRDASLRDLATNVVGGGLGYLALPLVRKWLRPGERQAAALAAAWSTVWLAGTLVTAWALSPSLPATRWWASWRAPGSVPGGLGVPKAADAPLVLAAVIAGRPVAPGPLPQWPLLRPPLLGGEAMAVRTVLAPGRSPPDIALVEDPDTWQELLGFHRAGRGVTFQFRTRATALRLRSPSIASGDFLPGTRPDTIRLTGRISGGWVRLDVERDSGPVIHRALAASPNWGWSFLVPFDYAFGNAVHLFTACWIATLVLPIAYWATQAGGAASAAIRLAAGVSVAAPAAALLIVPRIFTLPPVHWSEWLAWLAGSALGAAGGGLARSGGRSRLRSRAVSRAASPLVQELRPHAARATHPTEEILE